MQYGPVVLVPFAWAFTAAAHLPGVVSELVVLIALSVMDAFLLAFLVISAGQMRGPGLAAWQRVLAAGFVVTAAGTAAILLPAVPGSVLAITLVAWMFLPAYAYVRTGEVVDDGARLFVGSGMLSALGGVVYLLALVTPGTTLPALLAGIALVGVGQSAGIGYTAIRY